MCGGSGKDVEFSGKVFTKNVPTIWMFLTNAKNKHSSCPLIINKLVSKTSKWHSGKHSFFLQ
jgi:hypothetical protein